MRRRNAHRASSHAPDEMLGSTQDCVVDLRNRTCAAANPRAVTATTNMASMLRRPISDRDLDALARNCGAAEIDAPGPGAAAGPDRGARPPRTERGSPVGPRLRRAPAAGDRAGSRRLTKARGRCRSRGRTERAHRSLENHRTVFHKRPQGSSLFFSQERRTTGDISISLRTGTFLFRVDISGKRR